MHFRVRHNSRRGQKYLNERRVLRKNRRYSIAAKINHGACMIETVGNVLVAILYLTLPSDLTSIHCTVILWILIVLAINCHYIMCDDDTKDIVVYRGWVVGICSIFQSSANRKSIIRSIRAEVRAEMRNAAGGTGTQNTKQNKIATKNANTQDKQNMPSSSTEEEHRCFKMFYRRSSINRLLKLNYKADPLQYEICLENFVELEEGCRDNQYPYDNEVFNVAFEEFNLHKGSGSTSVEESNNAEGAASTSTSSVTLNIQSLLKECNHNGKIILQSMLHNLEDENKFRALFGQLQDERVRFDMPIDCVEEDKNKITNETLGKKGQPKDQDSKIEKAKVKTKRTKQATAMSSSETCTDSEASASKNAGDYSMHRKKHTDKLGTDDKTKKVPSSTSTVMADFCSLNVPID